mgnify:CR=1 FL=1
MAKAPTAQHTLMIVDDEPSQRKLIGGFFPAFGFTIIEAESSEAMHDSLRQHAADMIE